MRSQWSSQQTNSYQPSSVYQSFQPRQASSINGQDQKPILEEGVYRNYTQTNFNSMGPVGVQQITSSPDPTTQVTMGNPVQVAFYVISKEEVEQPWRQECDYLSKVIEELRSSNGDGKQLRDAQQANQNLEKKNHALLADVERLLRELKDSQSTVTQVRKENLDWKQRYALLEEQLNQQETVEQVTYLTKEVDTWRSKFIKVNHDFNETQEKLIMAEAELEFIKKQQQAKVSEK